MFSFLALCSVRASSTVHVTVLFNITMTATSRACSLTSEPSCVLKLSVVSVFNGLSQSQQKPVENSD